MRGGDFASGIRTADRLSAAAFDQRVISGAGVQRGSRRISRAERSVSPIALCGCSAEASGDDLPVVAMQAGGWQMQHDAPHRRLDPGAEFHEVFAQGADLSGSEGGARGPQTQFLVEHVGGGAQKGAQLIGEEAAAAGAVDLQAMVQLFDPVLDVTRGRSRSLRTDAGASA